MGEPARKLDVDHATPRVKTFEELMAEIERLPEGMTGEILDPGILSTMSRPGRKHRRSAQVLFRQLADADEVSGGVGWWLEVEAEVRFGDRMAVPDISGWRVERCPEPPPGNPISVVPDFCCEVLSPSTARKDRTKKLPLYARFGVEWIWVIDPDIRLVEVFQAIDGRAVLIDGAEENETKRLAPFDLDIDLARFWLVQKNSEPAPEE